MLVLVSCSNNSRRPKMFELFVIATSFILLACGMDYATVDASDGKSLPPIYWNISDPIFSDNTDHVQYVHIGQKMDIICPLRNRGQKDGLFYFILFQVDKEKYLNCDTAGARRLLTCNTPYDEKKYTFLFQDITPSPWGLLFSEKETYYFISTSDGTLTGLMNKKGGACTEKNMRLKITVNESVDKNSVKPPAPKPIEPKKRPYTATPKYSHKEIPSSDDHDRNSVEINKSEGEKQKNNTELVNSNGLVIGVVLGACAVLFIVLLGFLGYKVYRKRRHVKKYQSPGISASRAGTPQAQVTLLPISSHQAAQLRAHGTVSSGHHHHHHLEIQDLRPPPPYNESILDHAGSTMEV